MSIASGADRDDVHSFPSRRSSDLGAQSPSSPGVCPGSGYSGSTTVTSPDTVPTDGKCYVYTLTGTDNVGNAGSDAHTPGLQAPTGPAPPTVRVNDPPAVHPYTSAH